MSHEPIQFGPGSEEGGAHEAEDVRPRDLDLKKDTALTVRWSDGRVSVYPIAYLRKMSPSAEAKQLREEMASNPLTVLPSGAGGPMTATDAELVGRYALRVTFSDGHRTGLYTWAYLRRIDPNRPDAESAADDQVRP